MTGQPLRSNVLRSFVQRLKSTSSRRSRNVLSLGLCVSGGPDSMALAHLLKELSEQQNLNLFGLIVDHKARPESTDEACRVKTNLKQIGVDSSILTMNWPADTKPLCLSDFESQARAKRYHLLASAALARNIQHLLLGHHQDDQVETILMRLIRNQNLSLKGLAGMAASSSVPAAFDLFGVHVQGQALSELGQGSRPPSVLLPGSSRHRKPMERPIATAVPGGLTLERPLLNFKKADLIATCEANTVPYVVDPTNKDPRSSLRNAVRHMRTYHDLPRALDSAQILHLQQHALARIDRVKSAGNELLSSCDIMKVDSRTGIAKVKIPSLDNSSSFDIDVCAYVVGKLAEMVTPNSRVNHNPQFPPHIATHFCEPRSYSDTNDSTDTPVSPFAFDGVQFTGSAAEPSTWTLYRQTMRTSEVKNNTRTFIPGKRDSSELGESASEYLLWDNRFWVRIFTDTAQTLNQVGIRPLHPSDMSQLAEQTLYLVNGNRGRRDNILKSFNRAAPDKTRYTLPVLTFRGFMVALPTFNLKFDRALDQVGLPTLRWDVCYNAFSLLGNHPDLHTGPESETTAVKATPQIERTSAE